MPARRAVITTTATSTLVVLLLTLKPHHAPDLALGAPTPSGTSTAPAHTGGRTGGSQPGSGTYTGDPVSTPYGTVQVAATVEAGRLTAVKALQVPSANGRDRQIAARAVPRLTREALGANSAHIDAVSGASYTSQGYIRSLQSALDKAGA